VTFNCPNPSGYTMARGWTHAVIEMNTRSFPGVICHGTGWLCHAIACHRDQIDVSKKSHSFRGNVGAGESGMGLRSVSDSLPIF
jgi:hypothetical protein